MPILHIRHKMKSATEWLETKIQTEHGEETIYNMLVSSESEWSQQDLIGAINHIQREAFKSGMIEAAEVGHRAVVSECNPESLSFGTRLTFEVSQRFRAAIMSAIKKWPYV